MSVLQRSGPLSHGFEAWAAAGLTPAALRDELAQAHREFEESLAAQDFDQAVMRWTENAILWPQGRLPIFGRPRIRELLAQKSMLAGEGRFKTLKLTANGTSLYESGERGHGEVRTRYLCVWQPGVDGRFRVVREAWDYLVARDVN